MTKKNRKMDVATLPHARQHPGPAESSVLAADDEDGNLSKRATPTRGARSATAPTAETGCAPRPGSARLRTVWLQTPPAVHSAIKLSDLGAATVTSSTTSSCTEAVPPAKSARRRPDSLPCRAQAPPTRVRLDERARFAADNHGAIPATSCSRTGASGSPAPTNSADPYYQVYTRQDRQPWTAQNSTPIRSPIAGVTGPPTDKLGRRRGCGR